MLDKKRINGKVRKIVGKSKFLKSIITCIQDGISILDEDLNIVYASDVMQNWYSKNKPLEGKKCYEAYHNRIAPCDPCPSMRCLKTGKTEREIVPGLPGSGVEWIELFSYPHTDEKSKKKMVVEFVRNITLQKKLEKQLFYSQKMDAIGRLAGGIAHDFNNILSVIIGHAGLLMSKVDAQSPLKQHIEEILNASNHARNLTTQLLAFSCRQVMEPSIINLNEIIESMKILIERLVGERIKVVFELGEDLWNIRMNSAMMEQIIMNLVVNSKEAIKEGGEITIETLNVTLDDNYVFSHPGVVAGDYVMLAVSDNGHGISQEIIDNIFEPFFSTKETGINSGLGLSTVHGIVKQGGGYVWVYSEVGKGTTFKVYFPKISMPVSEKKIVETIKEAKLGKEKILVVEDNKSVREMIEKALQMLGYRVLVADTGKKTMEILSSGEKPDLLLTDVVLEDADGMQLSEKVMEKVPGLKILFMSGYTTNAIIQNGFLKKGYNFISKPFTIQELSQKIRSILDS